MWTTFKIYMLLLIPGHRNIHPRNFEIILTAFFCTCNMQNDPRYCLISFSILMDQKMNGYVKTHMI